MKNFICGVFLAGVVVWGSLGGRLNAQTHKVTAPQTVVRAVGVYEWTGDMAKPTASRLVPVTVFIDGHLEDAGVYLARPVPFALLSGNVYELQQAGIAKGTLDLVFAKHLVAEDATGASAFDDGWFGYGSYKGLAARKRTSTLKQSKTLAVVTSSDSDKPHFANKGGDSAQSGGSSSAPAGDPDRPTMKRRDSGGSGTDTASSTSASSTPADDPDRPTMKRRDSSGTDTASGSGSGSGSTKTDSSVPADDPDRPTMKRRDSSDSGSDSASTTGDTPADDPDRPTLKRRTTEQTKDARKGEDTASVSAVGSLNDDPNRPNLHRGKPASAMTEADLPKLSGMPKEVDLHQMVAVSDAANRDPHDFARAWEDEEEHKAILVKMQVLAQKKLAAYNQAMFAAAAAKPVGKRPAKSKARRTVTAETIPVVQVVDEELKAYTLSYGAAATYVYTAHTAGSGATLEYVTEVAQVDPSGEPKAAIESVTDAAHLDRTPRMRLVDAVDADASNRASLLFELREKNSRQFALYRVMGSQAEQIFLTGTTQ